jgi:hypothetical protein
MHNLQTAGKFVLNKEALVLGGERVSRRGDQPRAQRSAALLGLHPLELRQRFIEKGVPIACNTSSRPSRKRSLTAGPCQARMDTSQQGM